MSFEKLKYLEENYKGFLMRFFEKFVTNATDYMWYNIVHHKSKTTVFAPLPNQITNTYSIKMQINTSIVFVPIMQLLKSRFLTLIQGR